MSKIHNAFLSDIHSKALINLNDSVSRIQMYLDEYKDEPIGLLLERILKDYKSEVGQQHLYTLFISTLCVNDPASFLDELGSFVGHDLLDDGGYLIRWIKPKVDMVPTCFPGHDFPEIRWNRSIYGWEVEETTQDDPNAQPELVRDYDQGTQDPFGIILALDALVEKDARRARDFAEFEEWKQKLLNKNTP